MSMRRKEGELFFCESAYRQYNKNNWDKAMTAQIAPPQTTLIGKYRWVICALLFIGIGINYIDRQMIGILKPTLQADLKWTETDYASIVFWFQCAYAIGFLTFGRIIDRLGVRVGYAIAFTIWTIATIGHGLVHTVVQFAIARFTLGFGESGSFPASLKAVSEWFPQKERTQATWHLQCRYRDGAYHHATAHSGHHTGLGLACGIHLHRSSDVPVAGRLVTGLSPPA